MAALRAHAEATQAIMAGPPPEPTSPVDRILFDAEQFYLAQLGGSWVPGYLHDRGLDDIMLKEWRIGYAPAGWTTLTGHLRGLGHDDDILEAAGLARRSSRGTLIDHFRDRVMLPVRNQNGVLAGFTGRAHPDAAPSAPKYLNSPETAAYRKGGLLFGLHQARRSLARGATPVLVEGPFDAIAVSAAGPDQYAGVAPCGTALTGAQVAALGHVADLHKTGVVVAFDADTPGQKAAIRAYATLRPFTAKAQAAILPAGQDPAKILQTGGPSALAAALRDRVEPLSGLVIDARIDAWARRLHDTEGPLLAMRSAAALIADLLPPGTARQILQVTRGRTLETLDEQLRPIANAEPTVIARVLPADSAYQIMRVISRLDAGDASDLLAEVVNAVTRNSHAPGRLASHDLRDDLNRGQFTPPAANPVQLASSSFPGTPLSAHAETVMLSRSPPVRDQRAAHRSVRP
jgi:DNA primase